VTASKFGGAYGTPMKNQGVLSAATIADVNALTILVGQLGYPAQAGPWRLTLQTLLTCPEHSVVVAEEYGEVTASAVADIAHPRHFGVVRAAGISA
jgi:hypothetical protein